MHTNPSRHGGNQDKNESLYAAMIALMIGAAPASAGWFDFTKEMGTKKFWKDAGCGIAFGAP